MADRVVLSLDGGGIRGIIPAVVLGELERRAGRPIADLVDLLAGTSTGGLLATGLARTAQGPITTAAELLDLYVTRGPEIFSRSVGHRLRTVGGIIDEKYPARGLERIAREIVGQLTLTDLRSSLLVTAYDTEGRRPLYFGAGQARGVGPVSPRDFALVDVVRATSAAPTYFEALLARSRDTEGQEYSLIDGGVFANNPAAIAYAVARRIFDPGDRIHVVSIGTGVTQRPYDHDAVKDWGLVEWARPILAIMMDGVADAVDQQLATILGARYWRFNTHLKHIDDANPAPNDDMDDASRDNLQKLRRRGDYLVEVESARLDRVVALMSGRPGAEV